MFIYDVSKTPLYARNFVNSELLFIFANGDVSNTFNGKFDNVVLE